MNVIENKSRCDILACAMGTNHKTAYELSESQVSTPTKVIRLFWRLTRKCRPKLKKVLDMGAGDCRFADGGNFEIYHGIELDPIRVAGASVPRNGKVITGCAFQYREANYDACIGNPPYVRHHDIESPWKENTVARIDKELGIKLNRHGNLYLYFLCLGLLKTQNDGLLALVIPYEWVSRPSARAIRDYICAQNWNVSVYRFQSSIFDGVLTTASITIIDKRCRDGRWDYFDVTSKCKVVSRTGVVDSSAGILDFSARGKIWAMRGLSPGSQKIFTLTEGERIHHGLKKRDVIPCVTTLKRFPRNVGTLSKSTFRKYFVEAGERCWLIKSYSRRRTARLDSYLSGVPKNQRDNYTCRNQDPWFKFLPHPVPQLLVSSGFVRFGPKTVVNSIGATAAGSVYGIHCPKSTRLRKLRSRLLNINFESQVVAHAKSLKKIEVRQLNSVLKQSEFEG